MDYFIIHIEICPLDIDFYNKLDDEGKKKLMNPVDAKIVAIGIRYKGQNLVSVEKSEKEMLQDFWSEWERITKENVEVVGFNIASFDLPFITARSFIHDIEIVPFTLKNVVDLRDKINAYRYGPTRGRLGEFAVLMGQEYEEQNIIELYYKDLEKLQLALAKDLGVIDSLYQKAKRTRILEIRKW